MDENLHWTPIAEAWFMNVRTPRLMRWYAKNHPEKLAIFQAEAIVRR